MFRARTGGVDQAHAIANPLGMQMHFHPALRVMEELYGDAILTPRPSRLVKAGALPGLAGRPGLEPRGALWAAIQIGGVEGGGAEAGVIVEVGLDLGPLLSDSSGLPARSGGELALFRFVPGPADVVRFAGALEAQLAQLLAA